MRRGGGPPERREDGAVRGVSALLALALSASAEAAAPFRIASDAMPSICLQGELRPFVTRAAADLAGDLEKIFGTRPAIVTNAEASANAIVLRKAGSGFERYSLASGPKNTLVVSGGDDRGVMFGVYRFCSDFLGVDPFYFWSDLEPARRTEQEWTDGIALVQDEPVFKYRGWFINDEDFLNGFRPKENGGRQIDYEIYQTCFGPKLADRIYETAVRAGFNMMVCASYVDILNPDEKRLVDVASSRGLYITMHHQEPVGAGALFLDLHFPEMKDTTYASHPDLWRRAWKVYVSEWAKVPDVIWQLGLRGRKDRPFWAVLKPGGSWSDWGVESPEEDRRRAGLISQAMREQTEMIRAAAGGRPFRTATQLWMEGADLYRKGLLTIPEGTIVMFSDNSPGLKFQPDIGGVKALPAGRPHGLYYHLAVVHGNHWCELVPPTRTREILLDARAKGARELVLVNVANVRPFLFTLGAMAETLRDGEASDPADFRRRWCARRFGAGADAVAHAFGLYFAAYETELSRDGVSSYGSPRERAPLPILNDGVLYWEIVRVLHQLRQPPGSAPSVPSAYCADPDALTDVSGTAHDRINQDMFPVLKDPLRYAARAAAQAAGFERCLDQIAFAEGMMTAEERRQLFHRLGYPAAFLRNVSLCLSELTLALVAHGTGNRAATIRHTGSALAASRARDALDAKYNEGKWAGWFARDLKYPYTGLSAAIEAVVKHLNKQDSKAGKSKKESL